MIEIFTNEYFMKEAFREAQMSLEKDEVPVGAVVVLKNQIIGRGHNLTQQLNDVTAHAEMLAITAAAEYLDAKYLIGCTLYVTLEPCTMCGGALAWSQLERIVYGASDPKRGAGRYNGIYHPKTVVKYGIMAKESEQLMKEFFANKRVD